MAAERSTDSSGETYPGLGGTVARQRRLDPDFGVKESKPRTLGTSRRGLAKEA